MTRKYTFTSIARALLFLLPLAAVQANEAHSNEAHTHEAKDTVTVIGSWELAGLEPSRSGFMFTRMEVAETLC